MKNQKLDELHMYLVEYYDRCLGMNEIAIYNDYKYYVEVNEQGNSLLVAGEYLKKKKVNSIRIPDIFDKIGSNCFYKIESLKGITLGKNIIEIKDNAFNECKSLENLDFNHKLTKIGKLSIDSDIIEYLELPDSVKELSIIDMKALVPTICFGKNIKDFDVKNVRVNTILDFHSKKLLLSGLLDIGNRKIYFNGIDITRKLDPQLDSIKLEYINGRVYRG